MTSNSSGSSLNGSDGTLGLGSFPDFNSKGPGCPCALPTICDRCTGPGQYEASLERELDVLELLDNILTILGHPPID